MTTVTHGEIHSNPSACAGAVLIIRASQKRNVSRSRGGEEARVVITAFTTKRTGVKWVRVLVAVASGALLAGCARPSTVSSQGFIVNASYAIRAAEERKAADHAPNELEDARA